MTFKIDSTTVATPSTLTIKYVDVDLESYVTASGKNVRDRVATKRQLDVKWNFLKSSTASTLFESVKKTEFTVEYFDVWDNANVTKTFKVSDRSAPCYTQNSDIGTGWKDIAFTLIEV